VTPVVVMGLGEIGRAIARSALATPELRLAGAVDIDRSIVGRPLEDLLGARCPGLRVTSDPSEAFAAAPRGVLLHATGSSFERVLPQVQDAVRAGLCVVSTCEELAYPWLRYEEQAEELDRLCDENDVAVVGTGVNPGFALDRLPAFLSLATGPVRHVSARRVVDAGKRREALQRKVGAGLSPARFKELVEGGALGHVGLAESAALAALGCGLELDEVEEWEIEAVIAKRDHDSRVPVKAGQVAGLHQVVVASLEDREQVRLELTIAVGAESPRDEVRLEASPPLSLSIPGGVPGDDATAWAAVHAAASLPMLKGLVTVLDLPAGR
jgi:4-hydroxy-tetrahydrodipicolinate reductase